MALILISCVNNRDYTEIGIFKDQNIFIKTKTTCPVGPLKKMYPFDLHLLVLTADQPVVDDEPC